LGVGLHKFQAASDHLIIEGSLKNKIAWYSAKRFLTR